MSAEMVASSLGWSVSVPAGTYFLGDPCYAVPSEMWDDLLASCDFFKLPVGTVRRTQVLAFGTRWGDGTYTDGEGNSYPVDAGLIGLTPIALASARLDSWGLSSMGRIVTFVSATRCTSDNAGLLVFGRICINTDEN